MPTVTNPVLSQMETPSRPLLDVTIASISPGSERSEPSYVEARRPTSSETHPTSPAPERRPTDDNARLNNRPPLTRVVGYVHTDDVEIGPRQEGELRVLRPSTRHQLKGYILLIGFWGSGVAFSVAHVAYYIQQKDTIVGDPADQESKIRIGTIFASLSQFSLSAAVWVVYTQVVWNPDSVKLKLLSNGGDETRGVSMTMGTLNNILGADRSVLWLLNIKMLRTFTAGYLIALFAWALFLPPFFTPATIYVYDDTLSEVYPKGVPYLAIANATRGHNYSYSPDYWGDIPINRNNPTKDFSGPRTIVTLLTAAVSTGKILPIRPLFNVSSYSISFNGPTVRCFDADPKTISVIDTALAKKMNETWRGARPSEIPYYAFVPSYDDAGNLIPLDTARYQTTANATNEIMLSFQRYNLTEPGCQSQKHYQVCKLFNSTYHLNLEWSNGFQNIAGTTDLISEEPVPYPMDQPPMVSDMVQHAYSAFFWALSDQVLGSFVWYEQDSVRSNSSGLAKSFGSIRSPIQHNVLLGSSDLNYYFDLNDEGDVCRRELAALNGQRQRDILLAKGRTLDVLIPEMAFNMSVSMLQHTGVLTYETTRDVTVQTNVNRYGYNKPGLIIPYALSCVMSTCIVILGLFLMIKYHPMPDREAQDIIAASQPLLIEIAQEGDSHEEFRFGIMLEERASPWERRRPSVVIQPRPRTERVENDSDDDTANGLTLRQLHRQHGRERSETQR